MVKAETEKQKDTFNILGASIGAYRCKADVLEIERLMEEAFGIRIAMPLIDSAQVAVHMPLMGNRGADMIMETVEAYFNTLK